MMWEKDVYDSWMAFRISIAHIAGKREGDGLSRVHFVKA